MRRSKAVVAAVAGAAMFTLAACGGTDEPGPGDGGFSEGASSGKPKDPTAQGPAPAIEGATAGGELTILLPDPDDGPTSLDPAGLWSVTDNSIIQDLVFRSLTTFRRDPVSGNYVLVPDLATDLGTPSADFKTWTFTLKDGIKWENGDPVTAEEVAYGIKRSFDNTNFATGPGSSYSNPYFAGGDKYQGPYQSGENFPAVTTDGNTITLKMSTPFAEMDYYAMFPAIGPVPLGAKVPAYGLHPQSTGPYKIEKYVPNQELVLVKNDQWDPSTDPARRQLIDKYTFKFDQDPAVSDQVVMSDNAAGQTTIVTAVLSTDYQSALSKMPDRVMVAPQPCTGLSMPDYKKITEIEVRQALAFAYPYEDAWAAAGEIPGVTLANGVTNPELGFNTLPPGMAGRKVWDGEIDGDTIKFDPEKAKELLAKAGYEPGQYEASWVYDASTPEGRAAKEQIEKAYQESGFKTKAYPYTAGSLYDVWTDVNNPIHKKINIMGTAWCQDWPSGATFIPPLLSKSGLGGYNTGGFVEPDVEARIQEIKQLPIEEQADAWGDLDVMILEDYFPVINRGYYQNIFGWGSKVNGFQNDTSVGGAPNYREIWISQ